METVNYAPEYIEQLLREVEETKNLISKNECTVYNDVNKLIEDLSN